MGRDGRVVVGASLDLGLQSTLGRTKVAECFASVVEEERQFLQPSSLRHLYSLDESS